MPAKKFGLIIHTKHTSVNIGDFVQSLAAKQFIPRVDVFCEREELNKYSGEKVKVIMNGWYMHDPDNWPPTDHIDPLYVSIHVNSRVADKLTSEESLSYFRKHSPIGCRDLFTTRLLQLKGLDAYYSGCLTLTLGRTYKREQNDGSIYIIDPLFQCLTWKEMLYSPRQAFNRLRKGRIHEFNWRRNTLEKFFKQELLSEAKYVSQIKPALNVSDGLEYADQYLKMLSKAKLVITSRIHCALPCLAMNVPVIFLNGGFASLTDQSRFEGLFDFFHRIDLDSSGQGQPNFEVPEKIGMDFELVNKTLHLSYAKSMEQKVIEFLNQ